MNLEIAKSDLERALAVAALATGSATDLSSHYLFRVKDGSLEVMSYDLRVFACSPCVAQADKDGSFTVEAWRLDKWMGGVKDGVLKFSAKGDGEVLATGGRSKVRFRSLDPSRFPFWDDMLPNEKSEGSIDPTSLSQALSVSRWFVSSDETVKPELCQVEALEGTLWATDRRAISLVKVGALPDLGIRIPGWDVGTLTRFLSHKDTKSSAIEIKTISRAGEDGGRSSESALFVRPDGAYLGVTRPVSKFPPIRGIDPDVETPSSMKIDKGEFNTALSVLSSSAPKGYDTVTFHVDQEEGTLEMKMPCEAGGEVSYTMGQAVLTGVPGMETDFALDVKYLKGLMGAFSLDEISLGVHKQGGSGFVSFRHDADDNVYFSVVVWKT